MESLRVYWRKVPASPVQKAAAGARMASLKS
jgi:hypothetical protein